VPAKAAAPAAAQESKTAQAQAKAERRQTHKTIKLKMRSCFAPKCADSKIYNCFKHMGGDF
jgi:hypothetical protein